MRISSKLFGYLEPYLQVYIAMNVFYHGGRIGDCLYSLYTVKKLGGGRYLLDKFHWPGWSWEMIDMLLPFIRYQNYISSADRYIEDVHGICADKVTHDLRAAEDDFNHLLFPEWKGHIDKSYPWPGNISIGKRYAVHFGIEWVNEQWLSAPCSKKVDIVVHCPVRRLARSVDQYAWIVKELSKEYLVVMIGDDKDRSDWGQCGVSVVCSDFLEATDYVNSCKLFIGGCSSCNVVAEGLGKSRLIDVAAGCDNTYQDGIVGVNTTGMKVSEIVSLAKMMLG